MRAHVLVGPEVEVLPHRLTVFRAKQRFDLGGELTKVSYTAPGALAARYGLPDELASRLAGIDALTDAVIGGASSKI